MATRFSASLSATKPANLHILPSFCSQDLLPDGVYLTPVAGLHYVLFLFDQTAALLALCEAPNEVQQSEVKEAVRRHDDRLAYLEGNHGQLVKRIDLKAAIDAEFNDMVSNRSEEDWLMINGLKRLPSDLTMGEWQSAAKKQVVDLFKLVLKACKVNMGFTVLYVQNPLRYRTSGQTVYNVQMGSVSESSRLRKMYSGFFSHNRPLQCPPSLKGIGVRNKVTIATRVRISILQQFGANYKASNPGSSVRVKGYGPRPVMTVIPARGASGSRSDTRARTYNFIEAATKFPSNFSDENLGKIFQILGSHHPGELRSLFIVLSDDDRERCEALVKSRFAGSNPTSSQTTSGVVSGPGAGMDLERGFLESLRRPVPPPPPSPARSASVATVRPRVREDRRDRSNSTEKRPERSRDRRDRSNSTEKRPEKSRGRDSLSSAERKSSKRSRRGLKRHHQSKERRKKSKRSRRSRSSSSDSSSGSGQGGSGSDSSRDHARSKRKS